MIMIICTYIYNHVHVQLSTYARVCIHLLHYVCITLKQCQRRGPPRWQHRVSMLSFFRAIVFFFFFFLIYFILKKGGGERWVDLLFQLEPLLLGWFLELC